MPQILSLRSAPIVAALLALGGVLVFNPASALAQEGQDDGSGGDSTQSGSFDQGGSEGQDAATPSGADVGGDDLGPDELGSPVMAPSLGGGSSGGMPDGALDYGIQQPPSSPMSFGGARPDTYVVVRGDTMWDISGRFWGDPYFWPTLWSYNPRIGNAHFIYPGNILRFTLGSPVRPPGMALGNEPPAPMPSAPQTQVEYNAATDEFVEVAVSNAMECRPPVPFVEEGAGEPYTSYLYGFVDESKRRPEGRILRSPAEKELLASGDVAYLEFARLSEVQCGDIFTVYRPVMDKVRPAGRRFGSLGTLSHIVGELRIVNITDDYATAVIERSYYEIRRGDLLTAFMPIKRDVTLRSATKELDGHIVAAQKANDFSMSLWDIVYIDRGEADGLAAGDTFYITREGDGLPQYRRRSDNLPPTVVGKLVIVDLGESVSAAMVIESARALQVGDSISMQIF